LVGGGNDEGAELVGNLGTGLERGTTGGHKHADHLGGAVGGLGNAGSATRKHAAGSELGVYHVGFARAKMLALGTFDLEDTNAEVAEGPTEASTVGAGTLDASGDDVPERAGPGEELTVARGSGREAARAQEHSQVAEDGSCVGLSMGIHAKHDTRRLHRTPFSN
jgi:hypothetical protein